MKIVIDTEALDAAQVKADKLLATLKEAAVLADRLSTKEKPPEGGKLDPRCWDNLEQFKKEFVAQTAVGLCELFGKHLRRIAQATSPPQERGCTRDDITR